MNYISKNSTELARFCQLPPRAELWSHAKHTLSLIVKPMHMGFQKVGAEMGWTLPSDGENKTRLILHGRC
jgi:hypothetical protein